MPYPAELLNPVAPCGDTGGYAPCKRRKIEYQSEWTPPDTEETGSDSYAPTTYYNQSGNVQGGYDLCAQVQVDPTQHQEWLKCNYALYEPETQRNGQHIRPAATLVDDQSLGVDSSLWLSEQPHAGTEQDISCLAIHQPTENDDSKVCFGKISALEGKLPFTMQLFTLGSLAVQLLSCSSFCVFTDSILDGEITGRSSEILRTLMQEDDIELEATCTIDQTKSGYWERKGDMSSSYVAPCAISIIIYGPSEIFDDIGSFFEQCGLFLEHPYGCLLNVPYLNPHQLATGKEGEPQMTMDLVSSLIDSSFELLEPQVDLFKTLASDEELAEAEQPSILKTALLKHQKQALTFMTHREKRSEKNEMGNPFWSRVSTPAGYAYVNHVTQERRTDPPLPFFGGILADPMGLGKTLSTIALITSDKCVKEEIDEAVSDLRIHGRATLVVVPPPVLPVWEHQLSMHIVPDGLRWTKHHGKARLDAHHEAEEFDVVLTTYQTVLSEWRKFKPLAGPSELAQSASSIFSIHWRRVVLDEAHFIRNGSAQTAKAVSSLEADARWALTGTPIQNRLNDLASVLKFLRAYPYTEKENFTNDITHLWKVGAGEEAVKRLKLLLKCVLLRRSKDDLELPPRTDTVRPLYFDKEERALYDSVREQVRSNIDYAIENMATAPRAYLNVLQQINYLRMICNLGTKYKPTNLSLSSIRSPSAGSEWNESLAQEYFESAQASGEAVCSRCSIMIEDSEGALSTEGRKEGNQPHVFQCLKIYCSSCWRDSVTSASAFSPSLCGCWSPCPGEPVRLTGAVGDTADLRPLSPDTTLPTKITALVSHLKMLASNIKCVVFSYWTTTLDLIEAGLKAESIKFVRYDGKVKPKEREKALHKFRQDASIRVILMTLSCGAVGLDVTAASYAFLMEPHWNPTVEDQALARVHRMGQTRPVTTVRFVMKDSFEERVIETQEKKKDLANLLLGGQTNEGTTLDRLHRLRSLL